MTSACAAFGVALLFWCGNRAVELEFADGLESTENR